MPRIKTKTFVGIMVRAKKSHESSFDKQEMTAFFKTRNVGSGLIDAVLKISEIDESFSFGLNFQIKRA